MTENIWLTGLGVALLLVLSAIFSLSETAITGASVARTSHLDKNSKAVARVLRLLQNRQNVVPALLIGNNLVNVLASALMTGLLLHIFGDAGVIYATIAMTLLIVLFGEIMPKGYAIARPEQAALTFSLLIKWFTDIFFPLARGADFIGRKTLAQLGVVIDDGKSIVSALDEIRGTVDMLHAEGGVIKDERDMLGGLLDLNEMQLSDVMVHRTKIFSVCAEDPPEKIIDEILQSAHTRVPVWSKSQENIVGLIHGKDLLRRLVEAKGDAKQVDIKAIMTEPWFVPVTTSVANQLKMFKKRKAHFAFLVDEYGEFMGIVTFEDVLEEIVGEISDEHDIDSFHVQLERDGSVLVEGQMPIRDLNRRMDWSMPDEEATTVAGMLIHEARRIPEMRQAFTFFGYRMEVMKRVKNRITEIRVKKIDDDMI